MDNDIFDALKKRKSRFSALSDSSVISRVATLISTQCQPLDMILGGGIPVGRMTEVYGDTSTGKTLLALHILAETQAMGGIAVMLDTETSIASELADDIGVNVDDLIYSNPDVVEDVFADIRDLVAVKQELFPDKIMTIVWDSVAATSSDAEVAKVMKEGLSTGYPPTAREISQMMRVLKRVVAKNNIALIMLNQTREKIGVMFGNNVSTFGGKAIGFYSSVRLLMKQVGKIKEKGSTDIVGITARVYVAKSKISPPFGQCDIPIMFDIGIDNVGAVLSKLKKNKIITTSGGWNYLTVAGEKLQFRSTGFGEIYVEHENEILDMMYGISSEESEA